MTQPVRIALPARRPTRRAKVMLPLAGVEFRFLIDVGLDPATGVPLEVFVVSSSGKAGSLLKTSSDDVGVAISRLLQAGHELADVEAMFAPGGQAQMVCRVAALLTEDIDHPALIAMAPRGKGVR
jgi:hypothetical protein